MSNLELPKQHSYKMTYISRFKSATIFYTITNMSHISLKMAPLKMAKTTAKL